jgi:WD40 repeat protein
VTFVATSGDGRRVVSGGSDGALKLWDLEGGGVRELGGHGAAVHELALTDDGALLAVAGDAGLQVWDLRTSVPRPLHGHRGAVFTVGFAAGGRELVTGGHDGTVRRWELASGRHRVVLGSDDPFAVLPRLTTLRATQPGARHVFTYHAAARDLTVVTTAAGEILVLDGAGGVRWRAAHPAGMPIFAALAPDGDAIATAGRDGAIRRFALDDGATATIAEAGDVVRLDWAPGGRWLAGSSRGTSVRLWDLRGGGERQLTGHTLQTYRVLFSRDGALLASAGHDGTVRVWDPELGAQWTLRGHRAPVTWLAFGERRTLLSLSLDGTARLWRPSSRGQRALEAHGDAAYTAAFAARAQVAATASLDGRLRIWDGATLAHRDLRHPEGVWAAWLAPDGRHAVTSDASGVCRLWRVADGVASVVGGGGACRDAAAFDASGERFATVDRQRVLRLWRVADPAAPEREEPGIVAAAFAGDVPVWVTESGAVVRGGATIARTPPPAMAAWSAGGAVLATRDRHAITVVELAGGRTATLPPPGVASYDMRLTPDGRRLVIGDLRGRLHVYDTATGGRRVLAAHTRAISAIATRDDRVASAAQGELLVWDLETGRHRRLHGGAEWLNDLAFSPDGERLLTASSDGSVCLWSGDLAAASPGSPDAVARRIAAATTARVDGDDDLPLSR